MSSQSLPTPPINHASELLIRVALPVPLYRCFDYLPIEHQTKNLPTATLPSIGSRVQVPFGRRTLVGMVIAHISAKDSDVALNKLKRIDKVLDLSPILNAQMLYFAKWLAAYYHYPLGDVLAVMLPSFIRQGKPIQQLFRHWRLLPDVLEIIENKGIQALNTVSNRAKKQLRLINWLALHQHQGTSENVLMLEGFDRQTLKALHDKGLTEKFEKKQNAPQPVRLLKLPLPLNAEQQQAVNEVLSVYTQQENTTAITSRYQGFLLNGITGSGKTEVYLQAMQTALEAGRQVLILVPEIGLTPQTQVRFLDRFAARLCLLHSGLSDSQRMQGWLDCQSGQAQIIVGTRSAVLYPFADLGMIVVDEAHDISYKQQDTLRYHACDVALYRGHQLGIPVLLGSATPSLEHLKLVDDGKLTELKLTKRAGKALPPVFELIDLRSSLGSATKNNQNQQTHTQYVKQPSLFASTKSTSNYHNHTMAFDKHTEDTGLSLITINRMAKTLEAGEQVLVFLNRRGYAPILLCDACGWQADCHRCDAHMTVHYHKLKAQAGYLKCHHCDWQSSIPSSCPSCGSRNLNALGMGTTRLSENLHAIFANPQTSKRTYPIIQIDRDTTRRKGSWERLYEQINGGEPAILVGTQMLAKGHHFANVTMVVMPDADRSFLSADFRSPEQTAQLIVQVAGRAGRGDKSGQVLIQTRQPDNPLLLKLINDGYQVFARMLLTERQMLALPPFSHAALVRCEGKSSSGVQEVLQQAKSLLPPNHLTVLGPIPSPMAKKNNRHHAQLLLLSQHRKNLHQLLSSWWLQVKDLPNAKYMRLTLDIDPMGW